MKKFLKIFLRNCWSDFEIISQFSVRYWQFRSLSQIPEVLRPPYRKIRGISFYHCPSVRPSGCPSVHPSVHPSVRKLFFQKISPQKLLTGFLPNFAGMFHRWSSFKFLQIIVFHEQFWLPWQPK